MLENSIENLKSFDFSLTKSFQADDDSIDDYEIDASNMSMDDIIENRRSNIFHNGRMSNIEEDDDERKCSDDFYLNIQFRNIKYKCLRNHLGILKQNFLNSLFSKERIYYQVSNHRTKNALINDRNDDPNAYSINSIFVSKNIRFDIDSYEDIINEDNKPLFSARFGKADEEHKDSNIDNESLEMILTFRKNENNIVTQPIYQIERFNDNYLLENAPIAINQSHNSNTTLLTSSSSKPIKMDLSSIVINKTNQTSKQNSYQEDRQSYCSPSKTNNSSDHKLASILTSYSIDNKLVLKRSSKEFKPLTSNSSNDKSKLIPKRQNNNRYIVVKKSKQCLLKKHSKFINSKDIVYSSVADYHTLNRLSEAKGKYAEMIAYSLNKHPKKSSNTIHKLLDDILLCKGQLKAIKNKLTILNKQLSNESSTHSSSVKPDKMCLDALPKYKSFLYLLHLINLPLHKFFKDIHSFNKTYFENDIDVDFDLNNENNKNGRKPKLNSKLLLYELFANFPNKMAMYIEYLCFKLT